LRQHGLPDLRIADIIRDTEVIISARKYAHRLVLQNNNWELLRELIDRQFDNRFQMIFNS
jgi:ATP-dependent DNA helicase RecG